MKNIFLLAAVFFTGTIYSQYYYNDLIGTSETNRQMQVYLANKVKTMSATGYDQRGMKSTDFSEYHEVLENGRVLRASSIVNLNKIVVYSRFDDKGRVISMTDSSGDLKSITTYSYDPAGRITLVENRITDTANDFNQLETHQWEWCSDWYDGDYYRTLFPNLSIDPTGPIKSNDPADPMTPKKVLRGGSFLCNDSYCSGYRVARRMKSSPDTGLQHTGFRCVKDID